MCITFFFVWLCDFLVKRQSNSNNKKRIPIEKKADQGKKVFTSGVFLNGCGSQLSAAESSWALIRNFRSKRIEIPSPIVSRFVPIAIATTPADDEIFAEHKNARKVMFDDPGGGSFSIRFSFSPNGFMIDTNFFNYIGN